MRKIQAFLPLLTFDCKFTLHMWDEFTLHVWDEFTLHVWDEFTLHVWDEFTLHVWDEFTLHVWDELILILKCYPTVLEWWICGVQHGSTTDQVPVRVYHKQWCCQGHGGGHSVWQGDHRW